MEVLGWEDISECGDTSQLDSDSESKSDERSWILMKVPLAASPCIWLSTYSCFELILKRIDVAGTPD